MLQLIIDGEYNILLKYEYLLQHYYHCCKYDNFTYLYYIQYDWLLMQWKWVFVAKWVRLQGGIQVPTCYLFQQNESGKLYRQHPKTFCCKKQQTVVCIFVCRSHIELFVRVNWKRILRLLLFWNTGENTGTRNILKRHTRSWRVRTF